MALQKVGAADEIPTGGMDAYFLDGWEVLVVRDKDGALHAMNGTCPHEDFPLVHGAFDGTVLTCANHMWSFDAVTGNGINVPGCRLSKYLVTEEDGVIYVDTDSPPA